MSTLNPQAQELNDIIHKDCPAVLSVLSRAGKAIFFPKKGIISQTADAKGKDINATIGMAVEDDASPMRLPSIADAIRLDPRDVFPYAPSYGKPELRKVWKETIYKKNPSLKAQLSMPVVTNALTHGLSMAGYMFVDPGDTMILPDKYWGNYRLIFQNAYQAEFVTYNTFKGGLFDTEAFDAALRSTSGKQIVLFNFPNNPTGYSPTEAEIEVITASIKASAERGNEVVVITDDAYFGLVYETDVFEESLFTRVADLHENVLAVKIDGATKEDYVWGFRVGFISYSCKGITDSVCEALAAKTGGAVRGNISNAPHLSQSLVLQALSSNSYIEEKKAKYDLLKSRFKIVKKVLEENKEKYDTCFKPLPFNSGYFMCVELNEKYDGETVRQILLNDFSTGLISIGQLLRVAFSAVPANRLPDVFENIYQACQKV